MMSEESHRKQIADQIRHRLQTHPNLDESKIDDMLNLAFQRLRLSVIPGRSGFAVKPADVAAFVEDLCSRPGFRKDGGKQVTADVDAASLSQEEFRALSPMDRLRYINRGARQTPDGRVTRSYTTKRNSDGSYSTS